MIIDQLSNDTAQVIVVGFLCEYENISTTYSNNEWVELEGTIAKGFYHSDIPVIQVTNIKKIDCPCDIYVYPPDGGFASIL
ncbi:MAG: hypothetical protein IKE01_05650 [Clostridia bacterium]|nr:hypothetical protein [Clostridia bacterium]